MKAVMKMLAVTNVSGVTTTCTGKVNETYVLVSTVPASETRFSTALHVVLNPGDVLELAAGNTLHVLAAGFLFDDTSAARIAALEAAAGATVARGAGAVDESSSELEV